MWSCELSKDETVVLMIITLEEGGGRCGRREESTLMSATSATFAK
jgi:hypothetical protein